MIYIKVRLTTRKGNCVFLTDEQKDFCQTQTHTSKYGRGELKCANNCAAYRKRECPVLKVFDKLACYEDLEAEGKLAEVKRGEWIAVPSSDMSTCKAYKCSECDKMRYGCRLPPYCQECGAKMDLNGGAQE